MGATSNLGRWDRWYGLVDPSTPEPYGDSPSYVLAAAFVDGLDVADWGCGKGWLRRFVPPERYTGIDGSASPFADEIADLAELHRPSPAIVLRHVLEHDYRWREILRNAASSAELRLVVVLFTPTAEQTTEIAWNEDPGVPDLSFALDDLLAELVSWEVEVLEAESPATQYGTETILLCQRPAR
jgi:hypothetical protein